MPDETFDSTLFADAEEAKAAEDLFAAGRKLAAEGNPEGNFQAYLRDGSLGKSQSSDKLQITYKLELASGPAKGNVLYKYDGLGSDKQIQMSLNQLAALGVDTAKVTLKTLPAVLLKLKDQLVNIQCKQNGEFYNIYFRKAVKKVTPGSTAPASGGKF